MDMFLEYELKIKACWFYSLEGRVVNLRLRGREGWKLGAWEVGCRSERVEVGLA